ncbi:MAG: UDP-3-O-(3-hydroxymyristoyl)glucosamine N-acyltransferase, partial [Muribaculaceae bacterium]|nr:UDP-3-O-(3-hydroxymyristoyl)glucosamine N-acyltransferase [Muribaculaceae bacterium]
MKFSADFIASQTGGTVEGDGTVEVDSFCKIDEGRPGAISFLSNPKYTGCIYETEASIVLVKNDFVPEKPVKATLIRVEDPYATLSELLSIADRMLNPQPAGIESPSVVAADGSIHESADVGAF